MAEESAVNDQITDSVEQVNETVLGESEASARAMAQQIVAQAIGLAMQNVVHQQQQLYVLRNAATSAAAKAILQSTPADALKFAKEALSGDDVISTLSRLKDLMDNVTGAEPGASRPGPQKPAAKKTAAKKQTKRAGAAKPSSKAR